MIPYPPDHPASRIRCLPRPANHPGYVGVDPTLQVIPQYDEIGNHRPRISEAVAQGFPEDSYESLREEVLADIGAFEDGWSDDNDLLHCPDGYPVEDDGVCPDGHVSPFLVAGLI